MRRGFLNINPNEKKKEKQHSRINNNNNKDDQLSSLPKDIIKPLSTALPPDPWSSLPKDLLDSIAKRMNLDDLIRFGCVSRSWKSVSASLLPPKLNPWLIVPLGDTSTKEISVWEQTLGFFSLSDAKLYKVEIPQIAHRRICGSCKGGWLITVHGNGEIQLLHPFSKAIINLPPITKLPGVSASSLNRKKELEYTIPLGVGGTTCQQKMASNLIRDSYIYKAVMTSSDPATATIMLIQGYPKKLTFCRPGKDKTWKIIPGHDNVRLADVTFYRGQCYTVRNSGHVFVVGGIDTPCPFITPVINTPHRLASDKYYLVEASGALLLVTRTLFKPTEDDFDFIEEDPEDVSLSYMTSSFSVFKLDFDGLKWTEVYNLGSDRALFVGFNQSFSLKTSDFPGCKANCIYFTDDYVKHSGDGPSGGHDIGVFGLANGIFEKCYPDESTVIQPSPLWFSTHIY